VINQAAKGSFTFANLKTLGEADIGKVVTALAEIQRMETAVMQRVRNPWEKGGG
jgi:hypothetical protein